MSTKPAGWFSRRHQTDAAHKAAQAERREREALKKAREQAALKKEAEWRAKRAAERAAKVR